MILRRIGWILVAGLGLGAHFAGAADFSLWGKQMQVTFSGYTRPEPLTNFPALVILGTNITGFSYSDFLSGTNADLRFTDSTQTNELNYEIDTWNTNGSSFVWVQVQRLVDSNTCIWAYWGMAGTNAPACTTNGATWDASYRAVWHFADGAGLAVADSTTNGNALVNSSVTLTDGVVSGAAYFNGSAHLRTASSIKLATVQKLSISAWVMQPSFGNNDKFLMELSPNANNNANGAFFVIPNASDGNYSASLYGSGPVYNSVRCPRPSAAEWHHYTFVFDRASATPQVKAIYVDAVAQTVTSTLSSLGTGTYFRDDTLYFMSRGGTTYMNTGSVDEVRFQLGLVSSNRVWAEYMNVASNSLFATNAAVQVGGVPDVITLPATNVSGSSASLNGYLSSTGLFDTAVWVYWGETDGGTNAGAWSNSAMWVAPQNIGAFSTNVVFASGQECFHRFAASNTAGFVWAPSSEYLIATNVTVSVAPSVIGENSETGMFTFARPASVTGGPLTVNFTVAGSATRNSDYSISSSDTILIPAGSTSATVSVTALPDALGEGDETVILTLAPGAYTIVGASEATLTITNSAAVSGATLLWDNGAGDKVWSTSQNWAPDTYPQENHLIFNNTAAAGTAGAVNSIVDRDFTIGSLQFTNTGANYHTVQIPDGVTLTVTGAVSVGELSGRHLETTVNMTNGALVVNSPGTNIVVCQNHGVNEASTHRATLDLRGLASFSATVNELRVGYGSNLTRGTVYLPDSATVTASRVTIGFSVNANYQVNESYLYLGQDATINVDTNYVGWQHSVRGNLLFAPGLNQPMVILRDKAGSGRVGSWRIGSVGASDLSAYGTANFNGGIVDAMVNTLVVGERTLSGGNGGGFGYLLLDGGTIDATALIVGRITGNSGSASGSVTLDGTGVVRAVTVTLGDKPGTSASDPSGTLNLNGGTLQAVAITNGAKTATRRINWAGGTIQNYPGSNMTVAASITTVLTNSLTRTFDVPANLLMTVDGLISNAVEGASGIVKANDGTLLLNAANTFTGELAVVAGTLGGTGQVVNLAVQTGGTLAPGPANGIGTFSVAGDVTLAGTYDVEIDISTASPTNDVLNVTGNLTLGPDSRIRVTVSGSNHQLRYTVARYAGELHGRFGTCEQDSGFIIFYGTGSNSIIEVGRPRGSLFLLR